MKKNQWQIFLWEKINDSYMTNKQLSKELGISEASFSKYMAGHCTPNAITFMRINQYFGIDPNTILLDSKKLIKA